MSQCKHSQCNGEPWQDYRSAGRTIEEAGTPVRYLIRPGEEGLAARVGKITVTAGPTARLLHVLKPLARTSFNADSPAGSHSVSLYADPGPAGNPLAPGDTVAILETDGNCRLYEAAKVPAEYPGKVELT